MVWAAAVIDMVVIVEVLVIGVRADVVMDTLAGVEIIEVTAVVIALDFAVTMSYFANVLSDMAVDALIDALAGANANVCASLMTALKFAMLESL